MFLSIDVRLRSDLLVQVCYEIQDGAEQCIYTPSRTTKQSAITSSDQSSKAKTDFGQTRRQMVS